MNAGVATRGGLWRDGYDTGSASTNCEVGLCAATGARLGVAAVWTIRGTLRTGVAPTKMRVGVEARIGSTNARPTTASSADEVAVMDEKPVTQDDTSLPSLIDGARGRACSRCDGLDGENDGRTFESVEAEGRTVCASTERFSLPGEAGLAPFAGGVRRACCCWKNDAGTVGGVDDVVGDGTGRLAYAFVGEGGSGIDWGLGGDGDGGCEAYGREELSEAAS